MASEGLQQVAELGATRKLESELKDQVRDAIFDTESNILRWKLYESFHLVFLEVTI